MVPEDTSGKELPVSFLLYCDNDSIKNNSKTCKGIYFWSIEVIINSGAESTHKYGTYERKVQDLPILGRRTYLLVNAFEYQCDNTECDATTFAESIDGFLSRFGRMTERLAQFVCGLALETSCETCARILGAMNVKISGDTVIRLLLRWYSAQAYTRMQQHGWN